MQFPEIGYTPANLRAIQRNYGISREHIAELTGKSLRTIHANCMDLSEENHKDMSAETWRKLLIELEKDVKTYDLHKAAEKVGVEIVFETRKVSDAIETGSGNSTKKLKGWFGRRINGCDWYYLGENSEQAYASLPEQPNGPFMCQLLP